MRVDATSYEEAVSLILDWAKERGQGRSVCEAPVHSVMEARGDRVFRDAIEAADLVTPGGMPLVWMLRHLGFPMQRRVYGPELMLRVCAAAGRAKLPVGLYGSTSQVIEDLAGRLQERYPDINIVFGYAPPFRQLTREEDEQVVVEIEESGARVLFVGLGCPKQEKWMSDHRDRVALVMLGVGAAFDFISGNKAQAPSWLQRTGLEWAFRLAVEPNRLWFRYLYYNPLFMALATIQLLQHRLDSSQRATPPQG
jgi:N-acetylglucosaminyldiphosphoundecaprenol N-acetyl-beta-D-mannosaminyltransferase